MGGSPAPPSIASSDDVLAAVHDFVDNSIGDSPFLVVGESHGGYLSRALVRDRVDQVLGLALICPIGVAVRRESRAVPALPHYPRATFAVLDVAGHNLQIEQPRLFNALMHEWLDRVFAE
jgi:pimeloyl-ACP methyl ester carboxylesterase